MDPRVWSHEYQTEFNVVLGGRQGNMERFKPGVDTIVVRGGGTMGLIASFMGLVVEVVGLQSAKRCDCGCIQMSDPNGAVGTMWVSGGMVVREGGSGRGG